MSLILERYTPGVSVRTEPPPLPEALLGESPTTKTVYVYLEPLGEVEVSVTDLEERLGIARRSAHEALRKLKELGLLEVIREPTSKPGRYRIKNTTLEQEYASASEEWEDSGDAEAWDVTAGDGLDPNETW